MKKQLKASYAVSRITNRGLLHADVSTAGTAELIWEYKNSIRIYLFSIYQADNQYSTGVIRSATFQFPRARSLYIAICKTSNTKYLIYIF